MTTPTLTYTAINGNQTVVSDQTNSLRECSHKMSRVAIAIQSMTEATNTVTATAANHGLKVGQWITVAGATPSGYNGLVQVATVADSGHFTYTAATGSMAAASGTLTATPTDIYTCEQNPSNQPLISVNGDLMVAEDIAALLGLI